MARPGVQVDPVGAVGDDFPQEGLGDAPGQGAAAGAGKGAIEVAPVRQVAGVVDKAVDVDDRDRDQGAAYPLEQRVLQQPADDLHAIDLVPVDCRAHEQYRPRALAADHLHADRQVVVGIGGRYRKLNQVLLPGFDVLAADDQFFACRARHQPSRGRAPWR